MRPISIAASLLLLPFAALGQEGEGEPASDQAGEELAAAPGEADHSPEAQCVIAGDATIVVGGDVNLPPATGASQPAETEIEIEAEKEGRPAIERAIRIVGIYPGEVKLDVGADQGVKAGDRFAVFRQRTVETESGEEFEGQELVAVIEVSAVSDENAIALMWKGDRVQQDDEVRPAEPENESSHVYPRRLPHVGEVTLTLRPLIAVGSTGGFGGLADLTAAYWGDYMFFDIRMQPLGFGWTEDGNIVSASFMAEGGYDGRAFALGIGAGVSTVNGDIDEMMQDFGGMAMEDAGGEPEEVKWSQRTQAAFTLSQQVRLGARDGLHLTVYNLLMYHKDKDKDGEDDSGFIYSGTAGKVTVPLASRTYMFLEGGGGVMGYAFGDVGVFTWVRGAGDAGSVGISALAGGAGVWGVRERTVSDPGIGEDYTDTETITIAGPMVGVGLTYRFGF
jgi:hypothetical protein